MCGIVGFTGAKQAAPVLLKGLYTLEYRGYDSAGLSLQTAGGIRTIKTKGRVEELESKVNAAGEIESCCGIGHTRWATHGAPSDRNSHPHNSMDGTISLVHNGIIENYLELKTMLQAEGVVFKSDTDTEVVAHLFAKCYHGDGVAAMLDVAKQLRGSYALAVITADHKNEMICTRRDNPLIVGVGEGENMIASDIPAIMAITKRFIVVGDGEVVRVRPEAIEVYDKHGARIEKEIQTVNWDIQGAMKGGYDHFMIKEIMEQPKAVRDSIASRITADDLPDLMSEGVGAELFRDIRNIHIVACGSAYYAGLAGKVAFERLAKIPVMANVASEFRYSDPIIDKHDVCVVISQSGETADTVAALREAKARGATTVAIVNVLASTAAREADHVIYTWAGPEIAVATTKAYSAQLSVLYLLALTAAGARGTLTPDEIRYYCRQLKRLPDEIEQTLLCGDRMKELAQLYYSSDDAYFIGRGIDYMTVQEGSLKLKEIAYVHSEAYAGGELKHGPISLIEDGTPVIALACDPELYEKQISNIKTVKARGGRVILITNGDYAIDPDLCDHLIKLPACPWFMTASLSVIPLQFLAYYVGVLRGCDIDKPRNLAKSVTVE
ncbi:MAG: glutamine--fructose-6-phosphate transaminase (isomerizing) [Ruminococcaceae bacterium]|jgi:glucosamine--fructose-6-phosphate aminotransferase (isomerizing)|nr:glutamine--fructose-6-phosphate transaminase (isomerizing) [Oscillospiraceae bacterium]